MSIRALWTHSANWARTSVIAAALGTAALPGQALAARDFTYDGSFSEATSSDAACDAIFAATDYHARHVLAGPTRRTSVLNFGTAEGQASGFFDGVTFVGLLGGSNDLYYEKSITQGGVTYDVLAEGLIDYDVVYLEFTVTALDDQGLTVCDAKANYTGFRQDPH